MTMTKEIVIAIYLGIVGFIFNTCKIFKLKDKTVFLASFGDNIQDVIEETLSATGTKAVVLKEPGCTFDFRHVADDNIIHFTPMNVIGFIRGVYHLATSRVVFVDNYHVILAACSFKKETLCVQLWHANGAVKLFGRRDKSIISRPESAHRRFQKVYSNFHKIVVSSDHMAEIFKEAFGKDSDSILKTGMPRTDFFFDRRQLDEGERSIAERLPQTAGKTVIMYAPTYRNGGLSINTMELDLKMMGRELGDEYHLLLRAHPAVSFDGDPKTAFVTDVSKGYGIEELLAATDILVTDYSSIPFEFSLLDRPMIFYPYDLEEYQNDPGIWFDYCKCVPGNIVMSSQELIEVINDEDFHIGNIGAFNHEWNEYADGSSTERLIKEIYDEKSS